MPGNSWEIWCRCTKISLAVNKKLFHIICEIQIGFRGARNPVSLTRQMKLFINFFIDIGKTIDRALSQLYFGVMKSLFVKEIGNQ